MQKPTFYFWIYLFCKLGMTYTILTSNWVGLVGYTVATTFAYIETMKRS